MTTRTSSAAVKHQAKMNATGANVLVGNEVLSGAAGDIIQLCQLPNGAVVTNAVFWKGKAGDVAFGDNSLTARYSATLSTSGVTTFSYVNGWGYKVSISDDSVAKYFVSAWVTSVTYSGTIKWRVEYIMDQQAS